MNKKLYLLIVPVAGFLVYWTDGKLQDFLGSHPYENELSFSTLLGKKKNVTQTPTQEKKGKGQKGKKGKKPTGDGKLRPAYYSFKSQPTNVYIDFIDGKPKLYVTVKSPKSTLILRNIALKIDLIRDGKIFKTVKNKFRLKHNGDKVIVIDLKPEDIEKHFYVEAYFIHQKQLHNTRKSLRFTSIVQTEKDLVIDGDLSDWQKEISLKEPDLNINLDVKKAALKQPFYGEYLSHFLVDMKKNEKVLDVHKSWSGNQDLSSSFSLAHDENYIYFACIVNDANVISNPDAVIRNNHIAAKTDFVSIMFDLKIGKDIYSHEYNDDDFLLIIFPGNTQTSENAEHTIKYDKVFHKNGLTKSIIKTKVLDKGYLIECAILLEEIIIDYKVSDHKAIGFNYEVNDYDDGIKKYWSFNTLVRKRALNTYPKLFATAIVK